MLIKKKIWIYSLVIGGAFLLVADSCEKGTPTTVLLLFSTSAPTVSAVTGTSATISCNISSDGGSAITARGVCWSTNQNPTVSDSKTIDGYGIGNYISTIINLLPGTTYYVRQYATNSIGTAYGIQFTISTLVSILIIGNEGA